MVTFTGASEDRIRYWLREIWPKAVDEMPKAVREDLVQAISRARLEEKQVETLLLAHRREDIAAAKAPNTAKLMVRLNAMKSTAAERRTQKPAVQPDAPEVNPDAYANARLRAILEDLDDTGIRQVIAKGAELAPNLTQSDGPIMNAAERARAVMKRRVTADDVMGNQHLRVLAKIGAGLKRPAFKGERN